MSERCRHCKDPITRCPDHAPVTFGQCGGWRHASPRLHMCYPGDNRNPRIAEPETILVPGSAGDSTEGK